MKNKKHRSLLLRFDRILARDLLRQVAILAFVLGVISIISFVLLSISGSEWQNYCADNHISKWVFPLYLLIDGNAFNGFCSSDKVNGMAVFVACIIYVIGVIIFTGMIISVMTNMIERRVEDYRSGQIHYMQSGHYIIMGYDDMVPSFIRYIFEKDKEAYVLILTSASVLDVTEKLRKSFSDEQMKRVIINYGHRTTSESYKDIHLESAEEVFIVGYRGQAAHDAINVECVDCIYRYLKKLDNNQHPSKITCVFKDLDTYAAFKTTEIFDKLDELDVTFVPYNYFTGWAKQVFVKRYHKDVDNPDPEARVDYPAVFGNGIGPDDPRFVHLVFVGTTNFAVAFAMEAAHVLHFPNFNHNKDLKTRITFIDLNADKEKDEFITRNRHFFEVQSYRYQDLSGVSSVKTSWPNTHATGFEGNKADFLDVEFEFIKGDIFSKIVQNEISNWAKAKDKQFLSIFLAMENQRNNFIMGMNMPDEVYDNNIPLYIRQDRSDNFVTNLRKADNKVLPYSIMKGDYQVKYERSARYAHIYPFGMNETGYSADDKSIKRAKLINYLYCTADYTNYTFKDELVLNAIPEDEIWREADKMWKKLTVALKWSNLYSSYTIRTKLATLRAMRGLDLTNKDSDFDPLSKEEIEELARVEHNRWNVEKLLMGFRKPHEEEDKYESPKDAAKEIAKNKNLFIHHDIRPYKELDDVQKLDREFSRTIPWIMRMTEK